MQIIVRRDLLNVSHPSHSCPAGASPFPFVFLAKEFYGARAASRLFKELAHAILSSSWILLTSVIQEDGWGYGPLMSQTAHAAVAVSLPFSGN